MIAVSWPSWAATYSGVLPSSSSAPKLVSTSRSKTFSSPLQIAERTFVTCCDFVRVLSFLFKLN